MPFGNEHPRCLAQQRMRAGRTVEAVVYEDEIEAVLGERKMLGCGAQRRKPADRRLRHVGHAAVADAAAAQHVVCHHLAYLQRMVAEEVRQDALEQLLLGLQEVATKVGVEPCPEVGLQVGMRLAGEKTWKLHHRSRSRAAGCSIIQARICRMLPSCH